jgi:Mlc titration factor MtfA (ptsG expression regulator)
MLEGCLVEFLRTKGFEGSKGYEPTEEARITIAAGACLLIAGLDLNWYRDVTSIIVSPSISIQQGRRHLDGGFESEGTTMLSGEAMLHGPVLVAWDQALSTARHPEFGHDLVLHEFAHKIDMADGSASGIPRQPNHTVYRHWEQVIGETLDDLRQGRDRHLDTYASTSPAELFAVATEAFFTVPVNLQASETEIYELLRDFYRQDPAAW